MSQIAKRIRNLSKGAKASIALFLASMITHGISYVVTPIYTRLLPSEIFGKTNVFMTWLQIFGIIAMFSLANGVFNNGMSDWPEKRDEYSFSLLILSNIITIVFSIAIIIVYPYIQQFVGVGINYIFLMLVLFMVQPAYNFWAVRQRYEYKYKYVVIWTICCGMLSLAIAITAILLSKNSDLLAARIFGAEVPLIVVYTGFYFHLAKKSHYRVNKQYWKTALLFNLPLIPHYLSMYMLNSSDKLMISYLINDSATAYYSVAYSVAAIATIVWTAINSSLIPYTYEKCKEKDYKSIQRVTSPIIAVFAVACLFVIMLAPEVVAIMATPEYKEAIYVIPPIVGGVFFQVQYFMYANIVYFYKKPKYVMVASVTSTILNIGLNYIFIKKYGYVAAGYTTLFCYMVQAFIDYLAMKKVAPEAIYNMKFVFCLSVIVTAIALLSNLVYDYIAIRYTVIIMIFIVGYFFRNQLIQIVKTIKK